MGGGSFKFTRFLPVKSWAVYWPALLHSSVLWHPSKFLLFHAFTTHCPHLSRLTINRGSWFSSSYTTQGDFCCKPLCCVLQTIFLLVPSLWKAHFWNPLPQYTGRYLECKACRTAKGCHTGVSGHDGHSVGIPCHGMKHPLLSSAAS